MNRNQLAQLISERGLRPTQQRIEVYRYLLQHPVHPTAETIFQSMRAQFPTFSRTTIYNSLHALADAGLIRTVTIDAQEQRFDANAQDHAHFKCAACGRIYDFGMDEQAIRRICPPGFAVTVSDVYLTGRCPACAEAEEEKPA